MGAKRPKSLVHLKRGNTDSQRCPLNGRSLEIKLHFRLKYKSEKKSTIFFAENRRFYEFSVRIMIWK